MPPTQIVHLTTVHPRYDVRIFWKEVVSLAKAGFGVQLIVADGLGSERLDSGVMIHDIGKVKNRLARILTQPVRMLWHARKTDAAVFHFHDPELLIVGLILQLLGKKVIFDSHEDAPRAILSKRWIWKPLRSAVSGVYEFLENFVARRLSAIVAATPKINERFSKISNRVVTLNNYPVLDEFGQDPISVSRYSTRKICYIGGLSRGRGILEIVRAMEFVDGQLILAGKFENNKFKDEVMSLPGWKKVDFRGYVGRKEIDSILSESAIGLLLLHPEPNHLESQPLKLFEYMAAGVVAVASSFPYWEKIISDAGCGVCIDPLDVPVIARRINELLADSAALYDMGNCGRLAAIERYNWGLETNKLVGLCNALLDIA